MSANRKKVAVRKLADLIRVMFRIEETSLSGRQHGRLAVALRHDLARLKRLLLDDPDEKFWDVLQEAILKALKFMGRD
jgi:ABC-type uncharacterized transport system YnjBCD ATPase subunit